jgi:hypothetical protein
VQRCRDAHGTFVTGDFHASSFVIRRPLYPLPNTQYPTLYSRSRTGPRNGKQVTHEVDLHIKVRRRPPSLPRKTVLCHSRAKPSSVIPAQNRPLSFPRKTVVRHSRVAGIQWLNDSGFPHSRE